MIHNTNETGLQAPPPVAIRSRRDGRVWRVLKREVAVSCGAMLEFCYRHGFLCRERACARCKESARLDLTAKRFRCDWFMSVKRQKRRRCDCSVNVSSGPRPPVALADEHPPSSAASLRVCPACSSYVLSCRECMEYSLFSWARVSPIGRSLPSAVNKIERYYHYVILLVYPAISLVPFMPSPAIGAKKLGFCGFFAA